MLIQNTMKKTIFKLELAALSLFALTFLNTSTSFAQQDAQYTMYMFNPSTVNPAYAGSRDALSVTLLGRKQWIGVDGAPSTASLTIHTPLRYEAVSLGLSVIQDEIGPTQNTSFYGDISYRFKVSPKSRLAFGLKGGLDMFSADFTSLRVDDPSDVQYTTRIKNQLMPNFGFGVYLHSEKYYVGLSAPKIVRNTFEGSLQGGGGLESIQDRHFFLTAGYTFDLNSVVEIIPSFVLKGVEDAPLSADVNLNFFFYEKLWIGAGYRFDDSFVGNIVYHFTPKFRAGYAYDYTVSDLGNYNTGTHEIMINYDLDFLGKGFRSPRRF